MMQKISRAAFHDITGGAFDPPPGLGFMLSIPGCPPEGITTERGWFRHGADFLGLVLIDNIDRDFSWMAFEQKRQSVYCPFDLGVSLPTFDAAASAMQRAIDRARGGRR